MEGAGIGRNFSTGAYRDQDLTKLDWSGFLSPNALRLFAEYMHKNRLQSDGRMRGSDNWKLGIPIPSYKESLIRHVFEFWMAWDKAQGKKQIVGNRAERAEMIESLCGALFNLQGMLHELEKWDEKETELAGSTRVQARGEALTGVGASYPTVGNQAGRATQGQTNPNWGKGQELGEAHVGKCNEIRPSGVRFVASTGDYRDRDNNVVRVVPDPFKN